MRASERAASAWHRRGAGERELAADRGRTLEDDHLVAGRAASAAAARPAGPAADHDHAPRRLPRPRRAAALRSRPVRGFCAQRIGVPAW